MAGPKALPGGWKRWLDPLPGLRELGIVRFPRRLAEGRVVPETSHRPPVVSSPRASYHSPPKRT